MPLTTPAIVEQDGGLVVALFNPIGIVDQPGLDALVNAKLLVADAWMQRRMGANYNLPGDVHAQAMQAQAQSYLTLHYLTPILQACKVYGTHFPYMSEESPNYDALVQRTWKEEAISLLDEWVTVEQLGPSAFAAPYFGITDPTPNIDIEGNGLDPLTVQLSTELDFARGISTPDLGTVNR